MLGDHLPNGSQSYITLNVFKLLCFLLHNHWRFLESRQSALLSSQAISIILLPTLFVSVDDLVTPLLLHPPILLSLVSLVGCKRRWFLPGFSTSYMLTFSSNSSLRTYHPLLYLHIAVVVGVLHSGFICVFSAELCLSSSSSLCFFLSRGRLGALMHWLWGLLSNRANPVGWTVQSFVLCLAVLQSCLAVPTLF